MSDWVLQSEGVTENGLKEYLQNYVGACEEMAGLLAEEVYCESSLLYRHHVPRLLAGIAWFRIRCAREISALGQWREDGRQPAEVAEMYDEEAARLADWLQRMIGRHPEPEVAKR